MVTALKVLGSGGVVLACGVVALALSQVRGDEPAKTAFKLTLRRQVAVKDAKSAEGKPLFRVQEEAVAWAPRETAVIICDMWDQHWCRGAERRVGELAGPMNKLVKAARDAGALVIHAPSTCVDFYKETPQRKRAQAAPFAKPPIVLATEQRWGTAWCYTDKTRETELPIDDSDMGCDCAAKCTIRTPWTRQIATIEIADADAITDHGQETYNLLVQHKIKHVIFLGVHTNMCVLGRPFAIRQLVRLGFDVALVRDMTDTMYNAKMKPYVDHFAGTDLVVGHIERHWCPSFASSDVVGGRPFRFAEDKRGIK